ncbi:hemolysin family protein [Dethiosulfatarculus sandiegensis]|uniref:CBS domain-containing protein n=1 Tax=Dethiosulfatarculus sandiegensis TaxID=1429043 RepID=A0A0D2J6T5_9BACT|nr:hemolysin family protein [Dethiosulfatarculus sandiegensis]KIX11391.1 hypothetical protein X474_24215 [Dethiosulfatarculus sandiegensis]
MDTEPGRSLIARVLDLFKGGRSTTSQELEREIQGLVDQGEAQGFLTPHEGHMIEGVLELDQTTAGQIMVPRIDLAMVSDKDSINDIIRVITDSGHSRIPVYSGDPDHIVGVIYAKDLLSHWGKPGETNNICEVARKPFFVPQAMPLNELLTAFRRKRVHLAVVVDEYGGTAGVVTLEDVLEEIVGEIEDEYDQEEHLSQRQQDGSLVVDARLEVEELSGLLGYEVPEELPEGRFETVGGFITTYLGRVPNAGEIMEYGPLTLKVVEADDRKIDKVKVGFDPEAAKEPEEA